MSLQHDFFAESLADVAHFEDELGGHRENRLSYRWISEPSHRNHLRWIGTGAAGYPHWPPPAARPVDRGARKLPPIPSLGQETSYCRFSAYGDNCRAASDPAPAESRSRLREGRRGGKNNDRPSYQDTHASEDTMNTRRGWIAFGRFLGTGGLVIVSLTLAKRADGDEVPPPPTPGSNATATADPNVEVMTRGPVHEAYAVPVSAGQTAGVIVPKQPPAPIEEVPPDMKPEGAERRLDSRLLELGRRTQGFHLGQRRVARAAARLPLDARLLAGGAGPGVPVGFRLLDAGPCAKKRPIMPSRHKASRPGPPVRRPARTISGSPATGNGRGPLCLAARLLGGAASPIGSGCRRLITGVRGAGSMCLAIGIIRWSAAGWSFRPSISRPVAVYRPAVCLDVGVFSFSLFCRPGYGHYYFGDYYDDRYVAFGIRPWFYFNSPRYGYDPLFGYYRWYHEAHWASGIGTTICPAGTSTIAPIPRCVRRTRWRPSRRSAGQRRRPKAGRFPPASDGPRHSPSRRQVGRFCEASTGLRREPRSGSKRPRRRPASSRSGSSSRRARRPAARHARPGEP